jgi:hypothetical protein
MQTREREECIGWLRSMRSKCGADGGEHCRTIRLDLMGSDPHKAQAQRLKQLLPSHIGGALVFVDRPIDFNDQSCRSAVEINDKRTDWLLAAELVAVELFPAQMLPQERFTQRRFLAKLSRERHHLRSERFRHVPSLHDHSFPSRRSRWPATPTLILHLAPPQNAKQRATLPHILVQVVVAAELTPPVGVQALRWVRLTTVPVTCWDDAIPMGADTAPAG